MIYWQYSCIKNTVDVNYGKYVKRFSELSVGTSNIINELPTLLKYDIVDLDGTVQEELRDSIEREGIILYEKV
jgi:hypothetical protein